MSHIPRAKVTESADGEISCSIEETNRIRAALGLRPLDVSSNNRSSTSSSSSHRPPPTDTPSSSSSFTSSVPRANVTESADGEISCSIEETNRIRAALGLRPLDVSSSSSSSSSKEVFIDLHAQREEDNRAKELAAKIELARKEREAIAASRAKSLGESLAVTKQMTTAEWVALSRKKENTNNNSQKTVPPKAHRISALAEEEDEDGFSVVSLPKPAATKSSSTATNQLAGMKIHHGNEAFVEGETMILTFADTSVLDEEGKDIAKDEDMLINVDLAAKERTQELLDRKRKGSHRRSDLDDDTTASSSLLDQYDDEENEKKRLKRAALIIQENGQVEAFDSEGKINSNTNNELSRGKTQISLSNPGNVASSSQGKITQELNNIASDYITKAELLAIAKPKGKKKLRNRMEDTETVDTSLTSASSSSSSSNPVTGPQIMHELQQRNNHLALTNETGTNDRGSRAARRAEGVSRQLDEAIASTNAGMKAFDAAVAKETERTVAKLGYAVGYTKGSDTTETDKTWTTLEATTNNSNPNNSSKSLPPPLIMGTGISSGISSSVSNISRQRIYSRLRHDTTGNGTDVDNNNDDHDNELQVALLRARRLAKPEHTTSSIASTTTSDIHDPALRLNALLHSYQQDKQNRVKEETDTSTGGVVYSSVTEFSGRLQAELLANEDTDQSSSSNYRSNSVPDVVEAKPLGESTIGPSRGITTSTKTSNAKQHGWSEGTDHTNEEENDEDMDIETNDNTNNDDNEDDGEDDGSNDDDDDNDNKQHHGSFTANEEETNAQLHKGIASALHILRRMGATQQEEEYFGRAKDKRPDWDKSKDSSGSTKTNRYKDIELDYRDDEGHKLTPKQAFRELSYRFHGIAPSRHVKDKRLRQLEKERQIQQSGNRSNAGSSGNTVSSSSSSSSATGTMNILQRAQEMQGQAFITLEKRDAISCSNNNPPSETSFNFKKLQTNKMAHLQPLVSSAVRESNGKISPIFAAFIARMMDYTTPLPNPFDSSSTGPAVTSLLHYSNDPSISPTTARMQVTFESSIYEAHTAFENKKRTRQRKLTDIIIQVEDVVTKARQSMLLTNSNAPTASGTTSTVDIGELTGIQRLLLDYCSAYTSFDAAASGIKPAVTLPLLDYLSSVQKELVNALDSVFPRSAVRQFAETTADDRISQMNEAARLVLGIRLYNFDANKGGKGMEHVPSKGLSECLNSIKECELFLSHANELANHYIDVLNVVNRNELKNISNITPEVISVWLVELINRRQSITFTAMLLDELRNYASILDASLGRYTNELNDLKRTVSTSKAVSKDLVYPRFRAMADAWLVSAEIRDAVQHTSTVLGNMRTFFANSHCSLTPTIIRAARSVITSSPADKYIFTPTAPTASSTPAELVSFSAGEDVGLALQGYCPVSLSTALTCTNGKSLLGILREGSPAAGVAQYKGRYYLCSSVEAMKSFLVNPDYYLHQIITLTKQYWELVHVLQLTYPSNNTEDTVTNSFMEASLPALVQNNGDIAAAIALQTSRASTGTNSTAVTEAATDSTIGTAQTTTTITANSTGPRVNKKGVTVTDAAVATPVHFVERFIDPKYEFSEWALRRRAVQIANLRQCVTHSIQTDASHFRRDNDTQVYVPRETGTQTGINMGTNTDRTVQFVVGIRGAPEPFVDQAKANKIAGKPALTSSNTPRIEGPINSRVIQETLNG